MSYLVSDIFLYSLSSYLTSSNGLNSILSNFCFLVNPALSNASYVLELIDKNFKQTWIKQFSKENDNNLVKAFKTRDKSILLIGNSDKENNLYFLKLSEEKSNNNIQNIEVFPIPTSDYLNIIINKNHATQKDVKDLVAFIIEKVKERTGFTLESEVIFL